MVRPSGIRQNVCVGNVVAEGKQKTRRVERPLRLRSGRRANIRFERSPRWLCNGAFSIGSMTTCCTSISLLRRETIAKECLDDVLLFELLNGVAGKLAVEEVHRLAEIIVDGRAIAAVIELAEAREEVFRFFVFRFVDEAS